MAIELERALTLEQFLALPEEKPALEYGPGGAVGQKVPPKIRHSAVQAELLVRINSAIRPGRIGRAFPELRATFGGASFVPDVSVLKWDQVPRSPEGVLEGDLNVPPHVAIEVVSPLQGVNRLVAKALWYVEHGVHVALVIDPEDESVAVYQPGLPPRVLHGDGLIPFGQFSEHVKLTVAELMSTLAE